MKNEKLFNKVLSKSAMLLMVAGIAVTSGAPVNLYAQEVEQATVAENAVTNTADTTSDEVEDNTEEASTSKERCMNFKWSYTVITPQNCRPSTVIKPNRPCRPTKPNRPNKPNQDTNKPEVETPEVNKPEVETPEINKPEVETPEVNKPEVETPEVNKPEVETPEVNKPEIETPEVNKPEVETPEVNTPEVEAPDTNTPEEEVSSQTAFENEVLRLVNIERANYGLDPLEMDESIRNVARIKATDMYENNYFSHTSPTYGSPFNMMKKYGITYRSAAENIAKGQTTPAQVVKSWMNSSGHRANILNANYTHIGIGYEANGNHWVQMFVGK